MAGDDVAEDIAALLFDLYGRGRVPRRLWPRLVRLARGAGPSGGAVLDVARALRAEMLAAERGLRVLAALVDDVWRDDELTRAERREFAEVIGLYDEELALYYGAGDRRVAAQLGAERSNEEVPDGGRVDRGDEERQAGTAEPCGSSGLAPAAVQPAAIAWWAAFAALEAWAAARPGAVPDPASRVEAEARLGQWLRIQGELLDSGELPASRRGELDRLVALMEQQRRG